MIRELADSCAQEETPPSSTCDTALPAPLSARIQELLLEGHRDATVAEQLNIEAWSRASGAPFDAAAVRRIRQSLGLETLWESLREAGALSTAEMAVRMGVGLNTIRNWARTGRAHGRRCGDGRRWIFDPIDQQPEPIQQLAAAHATMQRPRGVLSAAATGRGAV